MTIFGGGKIITMFPLILRPVVGLVIGSMAKRHLEICRKKSLPIVEERLRNNERIRSDPTFAWRPPVCYANHVRSWVVKTD